VNLITHLRLVPVRLHGCTEATLPLLKHRPFGVDVQNELGKSAYVQNLVITPQGGKNPEFLWREDSIKLCFREIGSEVELEMELHKSWYNKAFLQRWHLTVA